MVFRSKIDKWLVVVLVGAAVISLVAVAVAATQLAGTALWASIAAAIFAVALPIWIFASTKYVVASGVLEIVSGPFKWRIPVKSITGIDPSNSPLSSPALSLKRLRISYGEGRWILVSPSNAQAFISAVERERNAG